MRRFAIGFTLLTLFLWGFSAQAVEMRGELVLIKSPLLEIDTYRMEPFCESMLDFRHGEDQPNFFNYRHRNCQGRYSFTLRGEPGSTVTLFGKIDYSPERGFLIVRKRDDQLIWVKDLESIPPNRWITREAEGRYGSYDVYYAGAPRFSQNIASVKWGNWWRDDVSKPGPVSGQPAITDQPALSEVLP